MPGLRPANKASGAPVMENYEILGEIPLEVSDLSLRFIGLPQQEIVLIFHNEFKSIISTSYAISKGSVSRPSMTKSELESGMAR